MGRRRVGGRSGARAGACPQPSPPLADHGWGLAGSACAPRTGKQQGLLVCSPATPRPMPAGQGSVVRLRRGSGERDGALGAALCEMPARRRDNSWENGAPRSLIASPPAQLATQHRASPPPSPSRPRPHRVPPVLCRSAPLRSLSSRHGLPQLHRVPHLQVGRPRWAPPAAAAACRRPSVVGLAFRATPPQVLRAALQNSPGPCRLLTANPALLRCTECQAPDSHCRPPHPVPPLPGRRSLLQVALAIAIAVIVAVHLVDVNAGAPGDEGAAGSPRARAAARIHHPTGQQTRPRLLLCVHPPCSQRVERGIQLPAGHRLRQLLAVHL